MLYFIGVGLQNNKMGAHYHTRISAPWREAIEWEDADASRKYNALADAFLAAYDSWVWNPLNWLKEIPWK